MDLIRLILLEVEKAPFDGGCHEVEIPDRAGEEISYHILLLQEAGLIEAIDLSSSDGVCWVPKRLTYEGDEFLDSARNDTLWAKAKETMIKGAGTLTLEGMKNLLAAIIRQAATGAM